MSEIDGLKGELQSLQAKALASFGEAADLKSL